MVSRDFADRVLAAAGQPSLEKLEKQIVEDMKPRSRELKGWTLSEQITIDRHEITTKNVIGVIDGSGPHAEETVVIGGHYDHLGRGGLLSGSLAILSSDIHNGADDNASGTSMVLEMARRLGARRDPPPRRVVFMAFSGEERGLLGSKYYVQHPLFPLDSTVMMFNCDMVGRLNAKNELTMIGTGTSPGLDALVDVLGKSAGLTIKKVAGMTDGFGGSDHQSFYPKGIPVLFAFTGVHRDYHRPSDDSDRINYAGMGRIADYLELLLLDIVRRPERPAWSRSSGARGLPERSTPPGCVGRLSGHPARLCLRGEGRHEARRSQRRVARRRRADSREATYHPVRRQAGRHDLRLHGKHGTLQAGGPGRRRRQARRQGRQAPDHPRQPPRPLRSGNERRLDGFSGSE